jgi:hypothetical protein
MRYNNMRDSVVSLPFVAFHAFASPSLFCVLFVPTTGWSLLYAQRLRKAMSPPAPPPSQRKLLVGEMVRTSNSVRRSPSAADRNPVEGSIPSNAVGPIIGVLCGLLGAGLLAVVLIYGVYHNRWGWFPGGPRHMPEDECTCRCETHGEGNECRGGDGKGSDVESKGTPSTKRGEPQILELPGLQRDDSFRPC